MRETDIIIMGAGCSGTSLAHHLENLGFSGKIELYDGRTSFNREQRWCSWGEIPPSLEHLAKHSWENCLVSNGNYLKKCSSQKVTYKQIYAPDFFNFFHSKWSEESSGIKLFLGQKISKVKQKNNFVEVQTDGGMVRAKYVFDARNKGNQNVLELNDGKNVYLHQTFLGWKVKFPRAVFDPETFTLMDFSVPQTNGLSFIYVLPYTETEALIESTSFSEETLDWHFHLSNVENYLSKVFGTDYEIINEESGKLPMTTAPLPTKLDENIFGIGIAGGHIRPSSGYAFHRIQRHNQKIAEAIIAGKPIPEEVAPSKFKFFDSVFLEAIKSKPETAHRFFMKLFSSVEIGSLTRFLLDESNFSDDLKVVLALPKLQFLKAFLNSSFKRIGFPKYAGKKIPKTEPDLSGSLDGLGTRSVVRYPSR
jgi:lycopene beta-cyclase